MSGREGPEGREGREGRSGGTWEALGLGEAVVEVRYTNDQVLRNCVQELIEDGHDHHVAVVGEGQVVRMDLQALRCLVSKGLIREKDVGPWLA